MPQNGVLQTLTNLGFDPVDAQVYLFLAKQGLQKASTITQTLTLTKQQIYPSLKRLQHRGIVISTLEHPARFTAIPFEQVLDLFIKSRIEEAQSIQQRKKEILSSWQSCQTQQPDDTSKFAVIAGQKNVYARIRQIMQQATRSIAIISPVWDLIRADQFGVFSHISCGLNQRRISVRFLTEVSSENIAVLKTLLAVIDSERFIAEGKTLQAGLGLFPKMVLQDNDQAMFFINGKAGEQFEACFWTNCDSLVFAFKGMFDAFWSKGTDIRSRMWELEV